MKITELENQVIENIKEEGHDWDGYPHQHFDDISDQTGIPAKQLRGVISSLEQKGLVQESELPYGTAWMICEK